MNPYSSVLTLNASEGSSAQKRIRDALTELMQEKPFIQIGVTQVCTLARTARSTFYLYYGNLEDVLREIENALIQDLIQNGTDESSQDANNAPMTNRDFIARIWHCCNGNRNLYRILVVRQRDQEFINKLDQSIKYLLWERLFCGYIGSYAEADLVLSIVSAALMRALLYELDPPKIQDTPPAHTKEVACKTLEMAENQSRQNIMRCRVLRT